MVVTLLRSIEHKLETKFTRIAIEYGELFTRLSFAFVFIYFGAQKPFVPGASPVREPVTAFLTAIGIPVLIPLKYGPLLIGLYEMAIGLLFLFNKIRAAGVLFVIHQVTTLVSLLVIPYVAFRGPWLTVLGVNVPYALDWFSAYVLKNLIFIGAFMLLFVKYQEAEGAESKLN